MNRQTIIRISGFLIIGILSVETAQQKTTSSININPNLNRKAACTSYEATKSLIEIYESDLNRATDADYTQAEYRKLKLEREDALRELRLLDAKYHCSSDAN